MFCLDGNASLGKVNNLYPISHLRHRPAPLSYRIENIQAQVHHHKIFAENPSLVLLAMDNKLYHDGLQLVSP